MAPIIPRKRQAPDWEDDLDAGEPNFSDQGDDDLDNAEPTEDKHVDDADSDLDRWDVFELDDGDNHEATPEDLIIDQQLSNDESILLPFDDAIQPSHEAYVPENASRYANLFCAILTELKDTSAKIILIRFGGYREFLSRPKTEVLPMHPRWLIQFEKSDAILMTDAALKKVPDSTMSILGDPQLNANNCIAKFRNLPKVSNKATEFRSGEYLDILDRLWHKSNPQNLAGTIETKLYKGATNDQIAGNRIHNHRVYLRQTLAEVEATFKKRGHTVPYHYRFGCQDSRGNDAAYECRSDFRSIGHVSQPDESQIIWVWLREIVNQILLNMLPDSCNWMYTPEAMKLVHDIRTKLAVTFGQLPDLSTVTLNRGCCLLESPRCIGTRKKACTKCSTPFSSWHKFKLLEPWNSFGEIICHICNAANPPPGYKWCTRCLNHHPIAMFEGYNLCSAARDGANRLAHKRRFQANESNKGKEYDPESYTEPDLTRKHWSEAEFEILKKGCAKGLPAKEMLQELPGRTIQAVERILHVKADELGFQLQKVTWSEEDTNKILQMRKEGKMLKEIAEAFPNRTKSAVQGYIARLRKKDAATPVKAPANAPAKAPRKAVAWSEEDSNKIFQMYKEGKKPQEIAKAFPDRTTLAVQNHLTRLRKKNAETA